MIAWTPTEWAIVLLAALIGFFVGLMLCNGGKWKKRYREEARLREEEVRRREELERTHKHWEAEQLAARARDDRIPPEVR
jgi:cytochrome c biogenesis protein ResB